MRLSPPCAPSERRTTTENYADRNGHSSWYRGSTRAEDVTYVLKWCHVVLTVLHLITDPHRIHMCAANAMWLSESGLQGCI
jgi:hypothetical protein